MIGTKLYTTSYRIDVTKHSDYSGDPSTWTKVTVTRLGTEQHPYGRDDGLFQKDEMVIAEKTSMRRALRALRKNAP